jgi:predicted nucleic acid binding AN1-type Zn finger protein
MKKNNLNRETSEKNRQHIFQILNLVMDNWDEIEALATQAQ